METKHLYKSDDDKAIFGVCGGVAEYFGIDSLIVRLLFVLFTLVYGSGVLIYIIAALVIPKKPERLYEQDPYSAAAAFGRDSSYVKADFTGGSPYGTQNYQTRPASAETVYRTSSTQTHYGAGAAPAEAPVRQAPVQPQPVQPAAQAYQPAAPAAQPAAQPVSSGAQEVRDAVSASMAAMEQLSEQLKAQEAAAGSAVTPDDPVKAAVQAAAEQVFDAPDAEYDDVDASTAEGDEALKAGAAFEAPAAEEKPAPEAPVYEAPKAEAPAYEAPKAEAPKYTAPEAPKYEAPKNDRYDQFQAFQNSYTRPEKTGSQNAGIYGSYPGAQAPKQGQPGQPGQSGKTVNTKGRKSIGMILILIGALLVLRVLIPHIDFRLIWGAAAIIAGAYLFMVKN
ncbi:MAG: PspC domain-containing protein [Firmicutes bacterium]|nr:PspC domain-containing protein [Bacillota bacterium]